ncbi:MAG: AsmA-like C-terminal domain-containing protein [bacterium]
MSGEGLEEGDYKNLMRSVFKEILALLKVVFGVFLFFVFLLFFVINLFLKPYVLKEISSYLKSEVKCPVMYVTPFRGIKVICVKPTASNKYGRFLLADSAIIDVDISGIRDGAIVFPSIILTEAVINFSKSGGKFNIEELIKSVSKSSDKPPKISLSAGYISFTNSNVIFSDRDSAVTFTFPASSLNIALKQAGIQITFVSNFGKRPFAVIARRSNDWRIIVRNRNIPLQDALKVFGIRDRIKGLLSIHMEYGGNFSDKNILNGNVFFEDVKYKKFAGRSQIFFDKNKFFAEIRGKSEKATVTGEFDKGVFKFANVFADFENITVEAVGEVSPESFSFAGQFAKLKITEDIFSGILSGEIEASGRFNDLKHVNLNASINDGSGSFSKLSLLYNVLQTLDIFNYLIGKFPDYSDRFPITRIEGRISKASGLIEISDMMLENRTSRTSVYGSVDLDENKIDIIVGFQVQKFVNDLLSKIPVVGYILLGKEKSLLPVFIKVTGGLNKPKIKMMPAKTISGPIIGIVERTFGIPFKMFKKKAK